MSSHTLLLLHGGLYESMDAERFWSRSGVLDALHDLGVGVLAPDRLPAPRSWVEDAGHIARVVSAQGGGPVVVVGGSNGCSTAVRLAIDHPGLAAGLVLCWPATAGSERVRGSSLLSRISAAAGEQAATELLAGRTLRGVGDDELAGLAMPAAVMAAEPENPIHRRLTVDRLIRVLADPVALASMPEPPSPGFDPVRFASSLQAWIRTIEDPATTP